MNQIDWETRDVTRQNMSNGTSGDMMVAVIEHNTSY